jgi:hypothetical protein
MAKLQFVEIITASNVDTEDSGAAKIVTLVPEDQNSELFVRLQSWDTTKDHRDFNQFIGRPVKVTIETID